MKKFSHIALFFSLTVLIIFIINKPTIAQNGVALEKFASVLQAEDILITSWSIHARESLPDIQQKADINTFAMKLKKQLSDWEWTTENNEHRLKIVGSNENDTYTETVQIISPQKNSQETIVLYQIEGHNWDDFIKKSLEKVSKNRIKSIFHKNTSVFSCMKGQYNDKIEKDLSVKANEIRVAFNGEVIEGLNEQSFVSLSTYSPKFTETLNHNNNKMNLQIALRNKGLGAPTTVVVGTPIITIEY